MRIVRHFCRLFVLGWKSLALWALGGQLTLIIYGGMPNWVSTFVGSIFGLFIGVLVLVNRSLEGKLRSSDSSVKELKAVSEKDWSIGTAGLGTLCGAAVARLLDLPAIGYSVCIGFFVLLGLSRKHIERILP